MTQVLKEHSDMFDKNDEVKIENRIIEGVRINEVLGLHVSGIAIIIATAIDNFNFGNSISLIDFIRNKKSKFLRDIDGETYELIHDTITSVSNTTVLGSIIESARIPPPTLDMFLSITEGRKIEDIIDDIDYENALKEISVLPFYYTIVYSKKVDRFKNTIVELSETKENRIDIYNSSLEL
jgi:hypothetical protein